MSVFRNVEVLWANVLTPNTAFTPEWQVTVLLDEDQAAVLQEEAKALSPKGIKFKKNDDGMIEFKIKRRVAKADGTGDNPNPVCINLKKEPFTQNIGNGSICNVQYSLYYYENKFGKGVGADFKGIQVVKHIPFGVQDGEEFSVEDESYDEFDSVPTKSKPSIKTREFDQFDDE